MIFITGKMAHGAWRLRRTARFNGAGDLHHRKVIERRVNRGTSEGASTEPVIFITGKLPEDSPVRAVWLASTEPVIFITGKGRA